MLTAWKVGYLKTRKVCLKFSFNVFYNYEIVSWQVSTQANIYFSNIPSGYDKCLLLKPWLDQWKIFSIFHKLTKEVS